MSTRVSEPISESVNRGDSPAVRRQADPLLRQPRHRHPRPRGRVKRNKLTHKHTYLRDAFYAERARREGVSEREIKPREQTNDLTRRLNEVREERDNYRAAPRSSPAMNVLTRENADLRKRLDKATSSNVTPLSGTQLADRS